MSRRLTNISSKKAHRALRRLGFEDAHQQGSHLTMVRREPKVALLTLVMGKKEINPYTLQGILRQGGVDLEDFLDAL